MFCGLKLALRNSCRDEVRLTCSVESSAAVLWGLSFIHTFERCLLDVCVCVCVRRCASRFNSRETYSVFKTNNPVHLEKGNCGRNCVKKLLQKYSNVADHVGTLRH